MAKILSIGEILWDVFPDKEIIGGAPFNLAVHARALGCDAYILSRAGCDRRGETAAEQVRLKGINGRYLQKDADRPHGTAVVNFTSPGIAVYHIPPDGSHNFIAADDNTVADINAGGFDMLCFGTLAQKGEVSRKSIQAVLNGVKTRHRFFDVNLRMEFHDRDVIDFSLGRATIFKINEEECVIVSRELFGREMPPDDFAAAVIKKYNTEHMLITLGPKGCAVYSGGRRETFAPPDVPVADTVGAGDAFSAGFIYSLLRGGDAFGAAVFGNAMGSFVASKEGATPALNVAELEALGVRVN
ncbi:MAG: PfkB family carbohydrate kinase [Oscillospiraceae bacterium]|nr:PfkB family carbohydrate kinase [Oscillospiraceae bacterium]